MSHDPCTRPPLQRDRTRDPAALLRGAAVEIARMPGVAARLRALHVAGPDGRCAGCASAVRTAPVWPCRIEVVAAAADSLPGAPDLRLPAADTLLSPPCRRAPAMRT